MPSWESIKKQRTPITWSMLVMLIGLMYSTGLLQLVWVDGVNMSLQSDAEASEAHDDLHQEVEDFSKTINDKFDSDMIARAKREIAKIDEDLRFGNLSDPEKEYKRGRKAELLALIECIREKKDNCI